MSYESTNIAEHFKQRGEWAELLFMARAAEQGFSIVRPWGDSSPYDVAIEHHGYLLRVQIKSTRCHHTAGAYKCHIDSNGVPYRDGMLDFIAAYVIPVQVWYIIPFDATHGQAEVLLAPHRQKSKYGRFKEAWHLLRHDPDSADCPRCGRGVSRKDTADERQSCPLKHGETCPILPKR
jgi:hypothetical protein